MNNSNSEVFCLNLEYDEKNDMLLWTVKFLKDNSVKTFASTSSSFCQAMGIKGNVSTEIWKDFCLKMKNKKMNFVVPEVADEQ